MKKRRFLATTLLFFIVSACSGPTLEVDGGLTAKVSVSVPSLLEELARNPKIPFFQEALLKAIDKDADVIDDFIKEYSSLSNGLPCVRLFDYKEMEGLSMQSTNDELKNVLHKLLEQETQGLKNILAVRLEKIGIAQPKLQINRGDSSIDVEAAGFHDKEMLGSVLQKQGKLALYETYTLQQIAEPWTQAIELSVPVDTAGFDSSKEYLEADLWSADFDEKEAQGLAARVYHIGDSRICLIKPEDQVWVMDYLQQEDVFALFPSGLKFMLGSELETYDINGEEVEGNMLYAIRFPADGNAIIESRDIANAEVGYSQMNGEINVSLTMNQEGADVFGEMTEENVGKVIAMTFDDVVYSAPMVQGAIHGGQVDISGNFTKEEANLLANIINSGTGLVQFSVVEIKQVSPAK